MPIQHEYVSPRLQKPPQAESPVQLAYACGHVDVEMCPCCHTKDGAC